MPNNVVVVFELASDMHYMKDVIQFPNGIAKSIRNERATLITRPNANQKELHKHIDIITHGPKNPNNDAYWATANQELAQYSPDWHNEACIKAAEIGAILIIFPWYGNPFEGAHAFKKACRTKRKTPFVILKTDGFRQFRRHGGKNPFLKYRAQRNNCIFDRIVCETPSQKSLILAGFPYLINKVTTIPNCPLDVFHFSKVLPIGSRPKRIVCVGRLSDPEKGVDILLDCWLNAHTDIPGFELRLIGQYDKQFRDFWDARLRSCGATGSIIWTGPLTPQQVAVELSNARIAVFPSRKEGSPLALIEAAVSGCSIVTSNVGAMPDLLSGMTGVTNSPIMLISQVLQFAKFPEEAQIQVDLLRARFSSHKWSSMISLGLSIPRRYYD